MRECRSEAFIMNAAGPKAAPCITLAEMGRELKVSYTQRETEILAHRKAQRYINTEKHRDTCAQRDTEIHTRRETQRYIHTDTQRYIHSQRHRDTYTQRDTDIHTHIKT